MTLRESYNFAPVYWSKWVVLVVGLVRVALVAVVALVVVIGGRLLALIVDRGHGLGFIVVGGTYV